MIIRSIIKHLFLDSTSGGFWSRSLITPQGESLIIPIHETWDNNPRMNKYNFRNVNMYTSPILFPAYDEKQVQFSGQTNVMADFIWDQKLKSYIIHDDPEFETWTFGIRYIDKMLNTICNQLNNNDQHQCIKIYMTGAMRTYDHGIWGDWANYIIGVFTLKTIYYIPWNQSNINLAEIPGTIEIDPQNPPMEIRNNFHWKCWENEIYDEESMVILVGEPSESMIYRPPIRLTQFNSNRCIRPFYRSNFKTFHMGYKSIEPIEHIVDDIASGRDMHAHPDFI